ncbi:5-aminolevulic acid synthase [Jannaschia sp. S6380]|uniref:5-aminolevulic acid synthase n=1 Tax=Jannaschia sp. S6380 TaxID=2926408 RepID=UPI001FF39270|nr:5-aminolevulic acid synthase [Jannaschia sp. S6380]MCK0166925.1 5-aminolevulic acid synthase [Jannaschia sp. S6380]
MIRPALLALSLALLAPLQATAQAVPDQATARQALFETRSAQIVVQRHPFLSEIDLAALQEMPKVAQLKYYGALAAAPDAGFQSETTRGAFNFHSIDAARAAAVAGCDAARRGGRPCVVVADILPRRYAPGRPLTLSQDASATVVGRGFRRAGTDATLAISPTTGAWGLGDGAQAAIASCAAAGARDCELAVTR